MRTRRSGMVLIIFFLLATSGGAADVWKTKPVKDWSREETRDFLRNSPWARQVKLGGSLLEMDGPTSQTNEGRGESSGAAGRTESSQVEVEGGGPAGGTFYYVLWGSSRIVRAAHLHYGALQGGAEPQLEPPALALYIISIEGTNLRVFESAAPDQLKAAAVLRPKRAKATVDPSDVKIRKTPRGTIATVQFVFPREVEGKPLINGNEKSVEFFCKWKDLLLKVSFDLNKMIIGDERDL